MIVGWLFSSFHITIFPSDFSTTLEALKELSAETRRHCRLVQMKLACGPNGFLVATLLLLLNFVRPSESAATVQVDKDSYCRGEKIRVSFDEVQGEGVWVGVYRRDDITDFATLPEFSTETLLGWVLTCGERSFGCDFWPTSGEVELETDELEDNQYTVVISEDRAALSAQAFTDSFQVVSCEAPTPAPAPVAPATPEPSPTDLLAGVLVVDSSIVGIIQDARSQIFDMIRADSDLIGKV